MRIELNLRKLKSEEDLSLTEYLLLAAIYENIDSGYVSAEDYHILDSLENKGYLRDIEDDLILDAKAIRLFESEYTAKAKEVLAHMNKLKKDLGISNRPFKYGPHGREIAARVAEGVDIELVKKMLTFKYNKWLGTDFQMYLRPSTLFNKTKFYNYIEEFEQSGASSGTAQDSRYALV